MSKTKAISAGLLAGFVAALLMTTAMLLLATLGVATPLVLIGDRLSVFIPPGPFLSLMGKVGGYNHLKQLGVGSTIAGQLLVGAMGGALYAMLRLVPQRQRASGHGIRESRIPTKGMQNFAREQWLASAERLRNTRLVNLIRATTKNPSRGPRFKCDASIPCSRRSVSDEFAIICDGECKVAGKRPLLYQRGQRRSFNRGKGFPR